jgi:hypothetical protein
MSELDRAAAEDALEAVYQNVATVADGLSDAALMLPSRCAGWAHAGLTQVGQITTPARGCPSRSAKAKPSRGHSPRDKTAN